MEGQMAANTPADPMSVESIDDVPAKQRAAAEQANPALARVENDEAAVRLSNVYSDEKEFPKWMYHRAGEAKIVDHPSEMARLPGNAADWHPDPYHWKSGDPSLRSPVTGGHGDPALRAAANPPSADPDAPTPQLPDVEPRDEGVVIRQSAAYDPQREQAAADSTAQTRKRKG